MPDQSEAPIVRGPIVDCACPPERGHRDRCPTLTSLTWPDGAPKIAPVQGFVRGIPWALHLEAYDAYCARWSDQAALIDLDRRRCRGGFSVGELDGFVPDWRKRVDALTEAAEIIRLCEEALDKCRAIIKFHVKPERCVTRGEDVVSAREASEEAVAALAQIKGQNP